MKHLLVAIAVLGATAYAWPEKTVPRDALVQIFVCDRPAGYVLVQGTYIGSMDTLTDETREASNVLVKQKKMRLGKIDLCPEDK